jgi:predicted dienelactone hydrolase
VALIGYSQGGYGVLTAGGASLDPAHPLMKAVAGGTLQNVARGTAGADKIRVPGVKAIVSMAPTGGGTPHIWGSGLGDISAPLLLIAGEADPVVGYEHAARAFFDETKHSDRYLLTFKQAGHGIALIPTPPAMQNDLWNADWFEDPIWRHDRLNAINLHFITAFLGLHLKGDASMRAYLDVPVEESSKGTWDAPADAPWAAFSPGGPGVTLWKGFQRRHAEGMRLEHRNPD